MLQRCPACSSPLPALPHPVARAQIYADGSTEATDPECTETIDQLAKMQYAIVLLFEGSLLGEGYLDCVHKSKHSTPALFLMYSFIIITIVLLLNMLIAMMGKTFDNVWESALEESGYQFARRVYNWYAQSCDGTLLRKATRDSITAHWSTLLRSGLSSKKCPRRSTF